MSTSRPSPPDDEPNAVLFASSEGITTIGINRPHRKNAINPPTARKLRDAFLDFENDPSQKACVFYGTQGTFCSGFDLHVLSQSATTGDGNNEKLHFEPVMAGNLAPLGPSRMQIRKPVICAVSGYAVAGGLELSLVADMRVVEEDAVFGVFCRRFGVPLVDGGTVRLPAVVGLGRAMDMILTGRAVGAQEALNFGLANRVVPKGQGLEEAMKIARLLLTFPQECMNIDRDSCYYAVYNAKSFDDALSYEFDQGEKLDASAVQGAIRFGQGMGRHGKL
jgi:enoyl-CoA hydratase/carnithine racemase